VLYFNSKLIRSDLDFFHPHLKPGVVSLKTALSARLRWISEAWVLPLLLLKAALLLLLAKARVGGLIEARPRLLKTHCALRIRIVEALLLESLLIKIIETLRRSLLEFLLKASRGRSLLEILRRSLLLESLLEAWNMSVHIIRRALHAVLRPAIELR